MKSELKRKNFFLNSESTSVVVGIPAFNEERLIAKVILEVKKHVDNVIVCDDGSTDYTGIIAEQMGAEVIFHSKNMGYGAAMRSLFKKAKELDADVLVTLDGDGQHFPEDIPNLIFPILNGTADIVLGSRFSQSEKNGEIPRWRSWGIQLISQFTHRVCKQKINDTQCGFRAFGRDAISQLQFLENGMGASVELLLNAKKIGLIIVEVPARCKYEGLERTSTKHPVRHGISILLCIFRLVVEDRPLIFLGGFGLVFLSVGFAFGLWMLQIFARDGMIITNIALASISFVLIGLFMIFTGITLYAISRQPQRTYN